nr:hypothetical protein [Tanacetum cinerariifolium]
MAAPVISISSNVSVESMGSSFPRVILIGSIFVEVSVTLEVGEAAVASPVEVLELDTHLSSEADPLESSPPPVSVAHMVLPFLCSDDSKSDTEIPERHVSPTTFTPEIPTALILPAPPAIVSPSVDFPLAPVVSPRGIRILVRVIPYPNIHYQTPPMLIHLPPRFVHLPLARAPRCSEAYLRWRSASLSTMYPPTTSESSARDSSSESSARPSQDSVEEDIDTDVLEDIKADATAVEVIVDRDVKAEIDAGISMEVDVGIDVEDEVESNDRGTIEVGVDMDAGIDISDGMLMLDIMERLEQVEEGLQDIYDHVIEIPLQRIENIETTQRQLEAGQLIASGERAGLSNRTRSLEWENLKVRALLSIERDRVDSGTFSRGV